MPNETKKSRAERRHFERQMRRVKIIAAVLCVLCVAGIVVVAQLNNDPQASLTADEVWYVGGAVTSTPDAAPTTQPTPTAQAAPETADAQAATQAPTDEPGPAVPDLGSDAPEAAGGFADGEAEFATDGGAASAGFADGADFADGEEAAGGFGADEGAEAQTSFDLGASRRVTITAVGDCTIGGDTNGTGLEKRFAQCFEKYGAEYFLENVRGLFESDDLTIVNLEGPLTTQTEKRKYRKFNFRGDPSYAKILSSSSVEVCNLANNHGLDFLKAGFEDTKAALEAEGVGYSGFGEVYQREINGVRVCSLGFTQWDFDASEIVSAVEKARQDCDLLIVSIHWGKEYSYKMTSTAKSIGKKIIDAGADLVIGNHSHVYGEIYRYKGKYIIYSLGNFCFGGNRNPDVKGCTVFQQCFELDANGNIVDAGINILPAAISSHSNTNDYKPQLLEGEAGVKLLKKIASYAKFDAADTVWMPDSFEVKNGLVGDAAQPTAEAE